MGNSITNLVQFISGADEEGEIGTGTNGNSIYNIIGMVFSFTIASFLAAKVKK